MAVNPLEEVAIRYKKIKIKNDTYVLIPSSVVEGFSMGSDYMGKAKHKIANSIENIHQEKYLIDSIVSLEDLQIKYDLFDEDELEFIRNYYFVEEQDNIIIVEIKDGAIRKRKISIPAVRDLVAKEVYERQLGEPSVVLNETAFRELLETENLEELKAKLERYRSLIEVFLEREEQEYVSRIEVTDGHITSIDTDAKIAVPYNGPSNAEQETNNKPNTKATIITPIKADFTVKGLEQHINERIFGQEKGIRTIAKNIYMNYTASPEDKVESILIVGPTGTGKTATLQVVSEYLSVPFKEVNTPNLVPQGIVGTSLEDCLYSLIIQSCGDVAKASRGILFFDELDKLGLDQSDQKGTIKDILLKFVEGDEYTFTIDRKTYTINTKGITKIFAGAFTKIFEADGRSIGFASAPVSLAKEVRPDQVKDLIKQKEYFGIELLDRIKIPVIYHDLDEATKKRILLESKLSEYLLKKRRYERQFGVELVADDSYIEAIFKAIAEQRDSIRILNNMVYNTLDSAEYELCTADHRGKRLILTRDTVANPDHFTLI
ncbi:MAG: AAA family ATPase [Bacilli bacterium]|nr:AAA family ATPase [Bacilli bacterium]